MTIPANCPILKNKFMKRSLYLDEKGILPDQKEDTTLPLFRLFSHFENKKNMELHFKKGIYHFYPAFAFEKYLCLSNNDDGSKRIVFPLSGFNNLTINGHGSLFIFHGNCTPFWISKSENIELIDFSIDWQDNHLFQAEVQQAENQYIDIKLEDRFPAIIENEQFILQGLTWKHPLSGFIEWDIQLDQPVYRCLDHAGAPWHSTFYCEKLKNGLFRLKNKFTRPPKKGNLLILSHHKRSDPAIFIEGSKNIDISKINIYQAPAMAIIAQFSENIHIQKTAITNNPDKANLFSAAADALHFTNCRGKIKVEDCLLERQMDDAINIHGIYTLIKEKLSSNSLLVRLVHIQQRGIPFSFPGDELAVLEKSNLTSIANIQVKSISRINPEYLLIESSSPLPEKIESGQLLENISWSADFHLKSCHIRKNRGRGVLIGTAGKVLIENNHFQTAGAAITTGAEASFWFESGAVRNFTIENNFFDICRYAEWGNSVISIAPTTSLERENFFHQNISIAKNRFNCFDHALVSAYSVKNISFEENIMEKNEKYPAFSSSKHDLVFKSSTEISIKRNNTEKWHDKASVLIEDCSSSPTEITDSQWDINEV